MAYCVTGDIPDSAFGGVRVSSSLSKQELINKASEQMDIVLEPIYVVPIASVDTDDLRVLRRACVDIAVGNYLADQANAHPDLLPVAKQKMKDGFAWLDPFIRGYKRFAGGTLQATKTGTEPMKVSSPDKYKNEPGSPMNFMYNNYE